MQGLVDTPGQCARPVIPIMDHPRIGILSTLACCLKCRQTTWLQQRLLHALQFVGVAAGCMTNGRYAGKQNVCVGGGEGVIIDIIRHNKCKRERS